MLADAAAFTVPCFPAGSATVTFPEPPGRPVVRSWSPESLPWQPGMGWLAPQMLDLYSQTGEPGWMSREALTETQGAAGRGGVGWVGLLPQAAPLWTERAVFEHLVTRCGAWGAWAPLVVGDRLAELATMTAAVGFAVPYPIADWGLARRALDYARPLGKPVLVWAWDAHLAAAGRMWEGPLALALGLPAAPVSAEVVSLQAWLAVVATTGTPVHFMRIATAAGVRAIAQGKAQGLPITASTTWRHLCDTEKALMTFEPNFYVLPPLGTDADRQALIAAIRSGTLDAIAVDHVQYRHEEKAVALEQAPPGGPGLAEALPALWRELVPQHLSPAELWSALTVGPARCLGGAPLPSWLWVSATGTVTPVAAGGEHLPANPLAGDRPW